MRHRSLGSSTVPNLLYLRISISNDVDREGSVQVNHPELM